MIKKFFLLLLMFSSTQAMAALSYTHLDTGNGSGGSTSFQTNSITVAANELVIIVVSGYNGGGTFQVSSVVYNGTATTLTNIASQTFTHHAAMTRTLTLAAYYFIPSGSSSGTITITTPGDALSDYAWSAFYFTGENTTTPIVSGQHTTIDSCNYPSTCTTLTATLGSPITNNDATVAAFSDFQQTIAATSGYTTIDNISTNQYQLTEYEITGTQAPSATWTATNAAGLAFEVGVAASSGSISKVSGVADASIGKILGVADASINKIAGVQGP